MDAIYENIEKLRTSADAIESLPTQIEDLKERKSALAAAIRDAEKAHRGLDAEALEPEDFTAHSSEWANAQSVCRARRALGNSLGIALRNMFTTTDAVILERDLRRIVNQLRRQAEDELAMHDKAFGRRIVA